MGEVRHVLPQEAGGGGIPLGGGSANPEPGSYSADTSNCFFMYID